jgi:hypothetical protein
VLDIKLNNFKAIAIGLLICFVSCKKPGERTCFKSAGKPATETRHLNPYSHIVISDNITLNLTQTTKYSATITAGEHLQNFIVTEVKNDTLYIRNNNRCNNFRSHKNEIIVDIAFEDLHYIKTSTSKNITATNALYLDSLIIEGFFFNGDVDLEFNGEVFAGVVHSGGANINVKGNVNTAYFYHIGTGSVNYKNLISKTTYGHSRTTANCFINASEKIKIEIHSLGNVYYNSLHNPKIELKEQGAGKLLKY